MHYEEYCLLVYDAVQYDSYLPTHWRNDMHPSFTLKMAAAPSSKTSIRLHGGTSEKTVTFIITVVENIVSHKHEIYLISPDCKIFWETTEFPSVLQENIVIFCGFRTCLFILPFQYITLPGTEGLFFMNFKIEFFGIVVFIQRK
jgi:hypothetical protein